MLFFKLQQLEWFGFDSIVNSDHQCEYKNTTKQRIQHTPRHSKRNAKTHSNYWENRQYEACMNKTRGVELWKGLAELEMLLAGREDCQQNPFSSVKVLQWVNAEWWAGWGPALTCVLSIVMFTEVTEYMHEICGSWRRSIGRRGLNLCIISRAQCNPASTRTMLFIKTLGGFTRRVVLIAAWPQWHLFQQIPVCPLHTTHWFMNPSEAG